MTKTAEIQETISRDSAANFYNWLGARHDWAEAYESKAKERALLSLNLAPGLSILNAGSGTGKDHQKIVEGVSPGGEAYALDLSWEMIRLTKQRTQADCLQGIVEKLPFKESSLDRVFSSYVLDLIQAHDLSQVLSEFLRVLKPGGILVNVSLSRGRSISSRLMIGAWERIYSAAPIACGGCRPITLFELAKEVGFSQVMWEIVEQFGIPSEIIIAFR